MVRRRKHAENKILEVITLPRGAYNKISDSVVIDRCKDLDLEFVGTYIKNYGAVVQFICPRHREHGVQESRWGKFRVASRACRYCNGNGKTAEILQKQLDERNVDVTIIGEYVGSHVKIKYRCNICGRINEARPDNLLHGKGCPVCGIVKNTMLRTKTKSRLQDELSTVQPNIELIGEYVNTNTKIMCRCRIDGYEWSTYPSHLLNRTSGCPVCSHRISLGERAAMRYLDERKIEYVYNHAFQDCKSKDKLRFDFYLPQQNTVIEIDGRQHYEDVPFFNGRDTLETRQERDKIKDDYCKKHNIRMVRIPYYNIQDIEDGLKESIKQTA